MLLSRTSLIEGPFGVQGRWLVLSVIDVFRDAAQCETQIRCCITELMWHFLFTKHPKFTVRSGQGHQQEGLWQYGTVFDYTEVKAFVHVLNTTLMSATVGVHYSIFLSPSPCLIFSSSCLSSSIRWITATFCATNYILWAHSLVNSRV